MKKLHLTSLLVVLFLYSSAQYSSLNVKHITVNDGLNDGIVNAICQDKFGYMWIATQGALNRFDGITVKRFSHIEADSSSAPNSSPVTMASAIPLSFSEWEMNTCFATQQV